MKFPNVVLPGEGPMLYADVGTALEASVVTWADLKWIREAWQGKIVVKGVHIGDDARRAIDAGADAVVVSNHGGRQLDDVHATIRALPEVVAAVKGQIEVLVDGGIRSGSDVAKALCLGARAVLVGRAYAYGLGAAGEAGVRRAVEILRADLLRTIKLLGCPSTSALDRSYVEVPAELGREHPDSDRLSSPVVSAFWFPRPVPLTTANLTPSGVVPRAPPHALSLAAAPARSVQSGSLARASTTVTAGRSVVK